MSDEAIDRFARELAAEVDEAVRSDEATVYSEVEFTRIVLERLAEEGVVENPVILWQEGTFGRVRYKITGYAMDDADDSDRLLLVATLYSGETPVRTARQDEIVGVCRQALKFYECSCKGLHEKIEPSNTDASDLARRIFEANDRIGILRLLVISDTLTGLKSVDMKEAFDKTRIVVDRYGMERLQRALGEGLTRDDIVLDFTEELGVPLPCIKASDPSDDYDAYLAAVPGSVLADIYEKHGSRLLELNVRAFLGVRGGKSVNAGLRRTIRQEPHRFLAYNNGIVATVDSIELDEAPGATTALRSVRGLQIVNGAQTTASLFRARRQDKAPLDGILVPIKIICVGSDYLDRMVGTISRSANSQNTVQPADFSANDPFHVSVENLANNVWLPDGTGRWFYERARGSYSAAETKAAATAAQKRRFKAETPKARRFDKTDLAKFLNAWNGRPHQVSLGSQKNFQLFMQALKDEHPDGLEPDAGWFRAFIAKAILFRAVAKIVRGEKFPAYRANITAYTVAALAQKSEGKLDFDRIWRAQELSKSLAEMLRTWSHEIDRNLRRTAGSRMPTEWAKKAECVDAIMALRLDMQDPLPPELANCDNEIR